MLLRDSRYRLYSASENMKEFPCICSCSKDPGFQEMLMGHQEYLLPKVLGSGQHHQDYAAATSCLLDGCAPEEM